MTEAEELAECKRAIKKALDSSVPYLVNYNSFMISPESWNELACLINPNIQKLNALFDKQDRGIQLTDQEIEDALKGI